MLQSRAIVAPGHITTGFSVALVNQRAASLQTILSSEFKSYQRTAKRARNKAANLTQMINEKIHEHPPL
jgi:hypothetical protein